jgi:sulfate adenylyltransferase (ADP) / ATP adenylyltransferase
MTLFDRMGAVAEKALHSGHLLSIPNHCEELDGGGVSFVLRYAPQLVAKIRSANTEKRENPFLPPEPELFVEAVGDYHSLVLNKFNVLNIHGLVITNDFVEQTDQLRLADFKAISQLLSEEDGLIFYNGGQVAGASQRHRHFQIVPKDMGMGELPIQTVIDRCQRHECGQIFPFEHRLFWLPDIAAETLLDAWLKLEYSWQPYNLLLTRQWMLVVPRRLETVDGISVNSLGFAGALLAKNEQELTIIRNLGPMNLLRQVSVVS